MGIELTSLVWHLRIPTQVNYLTDIPLVGTKLGFNDLSVRFYIDEGLENYVEIQNY